MAGHTAFTLALLCLLGAALCQAGVVQRKWREDRRQEHGRDRHRDGDAPMKPGPLKIFILAGQSNMDGPAAVDTKNNSDPNHGYSNGTLWYQIKDPRTKEMFAPKYNATSGNLTVRDDVWVWSNDNGQAQTGVWGPLRVGYGFGGDPHHFGPEFSFGYAIGDAFEEQCLIIKTAWGGRTLAGDFRPPSSGGKVGESYLAMLQYVQNVLGNLTTLFPEYDAKAGYVLSGFGWFQGWNDGLSVSMVAEYEKNMVNLVKDLRATWKVPNLPVSIPVAGFGGWGLAIQRRLDLIKAQFNTANNTIHPEINNATHPTVMAEETRGFWRDWHYSPGNRVYHYNLNAETFWLVGKAMGNAMVSMVKNAEL